MTIFVQHIDVTEGGLVTVQGHVSASNITVGLHQRMYIQAPTDGIWEFDLSETVTGKCGAQMLVPFATTAEFGSAEQARGVRVFPPGADAISLLKVVKVDKFSTETKNHVQILAGTYDELKGQLVLDLEYGGGCLEHDYRLEWDGRALEGYPPQYRLNLVDISEADLRRAIMRRQARFDITTPGASFRAPSLLLVGTPQAPNAVRVPLVSSGDPPTQVPGASKRRPIYRVEQVIAYRILGEHDLIKVVARGTASTPGWKNPQLVSRASAKGEIAAFDFVAEPPTGIVPQVLAPIGAQTTIRAPNIKRVRVFSKDNVVEAPIVTDPHTMPAFHQSVVLKPKELVSGIDGRLNLRLIEVNDSRCPMEALCIWQGMAEVEIEASVDGGPTQTLKLSTLEPDPQTVGDYSVKLVTVEPYPSLTVKTPPPTKVTVLVVRPT